MTRDSAETDGQSPCRDSPDQIQLVGNADDYMPPRPTGIDSPRSMSEFPDFEGYMWIQQMETRGPALVQPYDHITQPPGRSENYDRPNIPACTGMIVDAADAYLRKYALREVDYPGYYTRINSWESPWRWSVDGVATVSTQELEQCLRLVNSSGGIDSTETQVVLCAPGTLVTAGPMGIYLTDLRETPNSQLYSSDVQSLSDRPTPPGEAHTSLAGFDIPEENPAYQNALARYLSIVDSSLFDADITQYSHLDESDHVFERASGEQVRVSGGELARLNNRQQMLTDVCGQYQTQIDCNCETVQISESDTAGAVAGPVNLPSQALNTVAESLSQPTPDDTLHRSGDRRAVAGYDVSWVTRDRISMGSTSEPIGAALNIDVALVDPDLRIRTLQYNAKTVGEHPPHL